MDVPAPQTIVAAAGQAGLDESIRAAPNHSAVFLIWPSGGAPYLGRTCMLRRRLLRMLGAREGPSRFLNLRAVVTRVEYWPTASTLEAALHSYVLARRHFPGNYRDVVNLRMPPYVKLILSNRFPRTQVTARLAAGPALYFGPFRNRGNAEQFESQFLDQFQIRRCPEDLEPSPEHPGCIYGEMNMCLRPCQQVVGVEEYRSEVQRVAEFLSSGGHSLVESIAAARDRLSEEMDFEEAARQHKRYERVQQLLRLRDGLAGDIDRLNGVAVTASPETEAVELWFMLEGCWLPPRRLRFTPVEGKTVSLDRRLRELAAQLEPARTAVRHRQDHLAILARWFYSSWRDGEWLPFENTDAIPYRKLVNAIHRVATAAAADAPRRNGQK